MKKFQVQKTFVWLLCLTLLLQAFTACRSNPDKGSQQSTEVPTADNGVIGKDVYSGYLDEYSIVRPNAITNMYVAGPTIRLTDALSEATGKEVSSITDNRKPDDGGKEILIGNTNRTESTDAIAALETDEFSITVVGNKIVIVGENGIALDQGVKYFVENYIYGIQSVSEIKDYRQTDELGYLMVSDATQFMYGEPQVIFNGLIQQHIAIDTATGDVYYSAHDQFCKEDSVITRRTPNGHQEYMILKDFGHMECFDIERVGDKVYIWVGSQVRSNGSSSACSRFEFQAGTRYEWNAGETFVYDDTAGYNPFLDRVYDYVDNWGPIFDREKFLQGEYTPVACVYSDIPVEEIEEYLGRKLTYKISGGADLCGSYLYTCWMTIDDIGIARTIVTVQNMNGEVVDWTIVDSAAFGIDTRNGEANGIAVEVIDGAPRVFVAIADDSGDTRRYNCTIVVFSATHMDLIEPTTESLSQLKTVEHNQLPKGATAWNTTWTESDGVFSIDDVPQNYRLTFDEGAFKGEAYTYETSITIDGTGVAGIHLACATNICGFSKDIYSRGNYIGAQISISDSGKLIVKERDGAVVLGEFTISQQTTYDLKVYVSENGELTVTVNGEEVAVLQLNESKYRGGHVGLFVENGSASFADTKLTYHHP